jgi:hypothetical protein
MEDPLITLLPLINNHTLLFPPTPMSGPASTPMMRPNVQPRYGTPSTSDYTLITSKSATPSYVPYETLPQNNLYFPFPDPP